MKVFTNDTGSFWGKWNFVDRNNVLVGFSNGSNCCEEFGYLLTEQVPTSTDAPTVPDDSLEPYVFDTAFRQPDAIPASDSGGSLTFRLVADGLPDRFLTIYNFHNGYYSHGFEVKHGDLLFEDGSL